MRALRVVDRLDRYQRRRPWLGFPLAVFDKFVEDRGPQMAALVTYYGFVSLFPLLLALATSLRLVLHDHPDTAERLLSGSLARFPVVGAELVATIHPLEGSTVALVVGTATAVYGGLGFTATLQHVFDQVWGVPVDRRPHPVVARVRGSLVLLLLGTGLTVTIVLATLGAVPDDALDTAVPSVARLLSIPLALLVNTALFLVAFRCFTVRELSTRQVLPGAVLAAIAWQVLELGGVRYATADLPDVDPLYGAFALVLALLAWIYLEAVVVVLAAEVNAVLVDRLWPRALLTITHFVGPDDLTDADRRSLASYARSQRYQSFERIDVVFDSGRPQAPAD